MSNALKFIFLFFLALSFSCTRTEVPDRLIGIEMQYIYDNENDLEFALKFTEEGVMYQYKNGTKPKLLLTHQNLVLILGQKSITTVITLKTVLC